MSRQTSMGEHAVHLLHGSWLAVMQSLVVHAGGRAIHNKPEERSCCGACPSVCWLSHV